MKTPAPASALFPMIGKTPGTFSNHWKKSPQKPPFFPIVGKTFRRFSNHWKNALLALLLPLLAACATSSPAPSPTTHSSPLPEGGGTQAPSGAWGGGVRRTAPIRGGIDPGPVRGLGRTLPAAPVPLVSSVPSVPSSSDSPFTPFDFGLFAARFEDPDGTERTTAAGPFYENSALSSNYLLRATPRPFWVTLDDIPAGRSRWYSLWPLAEGKTFGNQRSLRILSAYHHVDDTTLDESAYHFWLLPFWVNGRTRDGQSYAGLFPLYGTARDFLWRDRYSWFLFPLWMTSSVNDLTTTNVLWPFYARGSTPDGRWDKLRVFPFYARVFHSNYYEKTSVLWPFWTSARYDYPNSRGNAWVLWPLCGRVDLSDQKGWSVLPPLFQVVESEKMRRVYAPWPFFQRETGPYRQKLYVWPLYGTRTDGALRRTFWLWPFLIHETNAWGEISRNRWQLVPFWTSVTTLRGDPADTNAPPALAERRTKLWPLFTRSVDYANQASRTRFLDLWPVPSTAVDASWAPFWSLVDYRSTADASRLDLLWGLYHQSSTPDSRSFSLFPLWNHDRATDDSARSFSILHGLFTYTRTPTNSTLRLLYLPTFTLSSSDDSAPAEPPPENSAPVPSPPSPTTPVP